jgi:hypothetical protein
MHLNQMEAITAQNIEQKLHHKICLVRNKYSNNIPLLVIINNKKIKNNK